MGQPGVLARAQREPWLRERGLIARFILLRPPSLLGARDVAPEPAAALQMVAWRERILELLRAAKADEGTDSLLLSTGAQDERLTFMREIEGRLAGEDAAWADWFGKLVGQTIRIAGLFHLIQYGPEAVDSAIPPETMASAIAVARHLSIHARTLLRPVEGSDDPDETAPHQAQLLAWIEAHGVSEFSTRDAYRANR